MRGLSKNMSPFQHPASSLYRPDSWMEGLILLFMLVHLLWLNEPHVIACGKFIITGIAGAIGHLTGAIAKNVSQAKVFGIDLASKISALPRDWDEYSDIRPSTPEVNHGADWSAFQSALLATCDKLQDERGLKHAAEAVIVISSSFSSFHRLDEYVRDGGRIVVPKGEDLLQIALRTVVERNLYLSGNLMGGLKGRNISS
ncbi:GroES-like protein [Penicillium canescens]|uniref:GroES-like protein n=1 Tax=Penicillium canescens TaxID=5083 RepID=A0AAD6IBX1_PENCN|nr:GroES-like protein [Penicillium canescens]KAJ6042997.1 GroES-like protein [Penicillium canescens]KAJ6054470.1 GroES-like protein [Penicillium canescens]KAJ6073416.1 GroES-like protein [Penicillium canescens]